jgi:hypothetical protein
MSLQVGDSCYASPVDAGVAACAAFVPVSQITDNGAKFRTIYCSGADLATGGLQLVVTTTDTVTGGASTTAEITQQIAFPPCLEQVKTDAYLSIFGAVLAAVVICYAVWRVVAFMNSNSRVPE